MNQIASGKRNNEDFTLKGGCDPRCGWFCLVGLLLIQAIAEMDVNQTYVLVLVLRPRELKFGLKSGLNVIS